MRLFALLTAAFVLGIAAFAAVLPSADAYVPGVNDGPPERFKTIAEAERTVGFDFPDAAAPLGWHVEDVTVIPAYYVRRLLAENPELAYRPQPNQESTRYVWGSVPNPPPGVHSFVSIAYRSDSGGVLALNMNYPGSRGAINRGSRLPFMSYARDIKQESVRVGSTPATLISYTTEAGDVMRVAWRVNRVPVTATAFNFTPNPSYRITQDEFIAFLATVR
jgi:hypothetical protein